MPVCTICTHKERNQIDEKLVVGESLRNVAKQFGTSVAALHRHKKDHLPAQLVKATEAKEIAHADNLLGQIKELQQRAMGILDKAENGKDWRGAVGAIREARACIETVGKLTDQLTDKQVINNNVIIYIPDNGRNDATS